MEKLPSYKEIKGYYKDVYNSVRRSVVGRDLYDKQQTEPIKSVKAGIGNCSPLGIEGLAFDQQELFNLYQGVHLAKILYVEEGKRFEPEQAADFLATMFFKVDDQFFDKIKDDLGIDPTLLQHVKQKRTLLQNWENGLQWAEKNDEIVNKPEKLKFVSAFGIQQHTDIRMFTEKHDVNFSDHEKAVCLCAWSIALRMQDTLPDYFQTLIQKEQMLENPNNSDFGHLEL